MVQRVLFYGLFLVAVAVLPYFSSKWSQASRPTGNGESEILADSSTSVATTSGNVGLALASPVAPPEAQRAQVPLVSLDEAVRFDVTAPWLFQRWPRVVAGLPEGTLQGYRVPLVTGSGQDDIAGALTYYFNERQICQRITFQGTVGDPRKLVAYVIRRFELRGQRSADPGVMLYQTRWNGKPVSELSIRPARVVKASNPHARYEVAMVLASWSGR
jgi:hypothetical protein